MKSGTREMVFTRSGPGKGYFYAAMSPDERFLASSQVFSRTVTLWSIPDGEVAMQLVGHGQFPIGAAFSPVGCLLASIASDGEVNVWDLASKHVIHTARVSPEQFKSLDFGAEGPLTVHYHGDAPSKRIEVPLVPESPSAP